LVINLDTSIHTARQCSKSWKHCLHRCCSCGYSRSTTQSRLH